MNSRERVNLALQHQETDRIPLDIGSTPVTGMHVASIYRLRQALGLDFPGMPVKVVEPYQMLGEIAPDLLNALGVDVVGLGGRKTMFGYPCENWKSWTLFDGTPVLVPEQFHTQPETDGSILMYPEGDLSAPPSGKMPSGGYYFDSLPRNPLPQDYKLDIEENLEEFKPISEEDLAHFSTETNRLFTQTDKAILANFGGTAFGDIALVPASWLKNPRGIRNIEDWYVSTITRREHVYRIFERQCEIALQNLEKLYAVIGNRITAIYMTGTDFGTQTGLFLSPKTYRDLYQLFQKQLNEWVHKNTPWKCFIHSCGAVSRLIPDFIEAGFDILNPVQISAVGMDAEPLKRNFGERITFWGGGVDTQWTLPFGKPEEVTQQVQERMRIFGRNGGFVFAAIHNIQADIPTANLLALFQAINGFPHDRMEISGNNQGE